MFFSNLVNEVTGKVERNKGNSIPIIFPDTVENLTNHTIRVSDGKLLVTDSNVGKNIFDLDEKSMILPSIKTKSCPLSFDDVKDSEENAIVTVCTKGIKFYNDVPTYLNVLFVNDDFMIVALIFGACEFQFLDGSFISLERCNSVNLEGKTLHSKVFSCSDLHNRTICKTESGWDKTYEMICPLFVRATKKDNGISFRCVQQNAYVFNEKALEDRKAYEEKVAEEKRLRIEKKNKELREKREKQAEIERQKQLEMEKKRQEEELLAESNKKAKKTAKKTSEVVYETSKPGERNSGAEAFLAFVDSM